MANRAAGQNHLGFGEVAAGLLVGGLGDVAGGDRTEQAAFVAGVDFDRDGQIRQLLGPALGMGDLLVVRGEQFPAALLEFFQIRFGRRDGLALGKQEVPGVTGLDLDGLADVAKLGDFFQQNYVHRNFLSAVRRAQPLFGRRPRKSYQLSMIATKMSKYIMMGKISNTYIATSHRTDAFFHATSAWARASPANAKGAAR